jgi:uncharacterized protein YbaR (Trm112 family)/SAM-dependent methyltransferase
MEGKLLDILRCPYCGGRLRPQEGPYHEERSGRVETGILGCACCAYPVVAGIPYLCLDAAADRAMRLLGRGEKQKAFFTLLGLRGARRKRFERLLQSSSALTWRAALKALSTGGEGRYFLYRFSDPTFVCSQAVVQAVGPLTLPSPPSERGRGEGEGGRAVLDLCGGTGHLTRVLCRLAGASPVILADNTFWEVWLARRFLAPACQPVCCDANQPLPFAADAFALVVCSDAFHYVWSKRLLAGEMARLVGGRGTILLPHLHNALGANHSAGLPLTPAHYRSLFAGLAVRLFPESAVLDGVLNRRPVDLSANYPDGDLNKENALLLAASRREGLFRVYDSDNGRWPGRLVVNPLYRRESRGGTVRLMLRFPSPDYEEEFGDCKRYLPRRVELTAGMVRSLEAGRTSGILNELAERYVLLDLPEGYL